MERSDIFSAGSLTRRGMMTYSALGLLTMSMGCRMREAVSPEKSSAVERPAEGAGERYAREFPEQIPGAMKVEKRIVPGSSHCVVHVRQVHKNDRSLLEVLDDPRINPETEAGRKYLAEVKASLELFEQRGKLVLEIVQGDIYDILVSLNDQGLMECVYVEGFTDDSMRKMKKQLDTAKSLAAVQNITKYSGPLLMYYEKKGDIRGAEDADLNERANAYMDDLIMKAERAEISEADLLFKEDKGTVVFDDRENYVHDKGHRETKIGITTVYGADHDWTNNLYEWNEAHPNDRYSLIVISPTGLEESESLDKDLKEFFRKHGLDSEEIL